MYLRCGQFLSEINKIKIMIYQTEQDSEELFLSGNLRERPGNI
jgi:hypothetical protein